MKPTAVLLGLLLALTPVRRAEGADPAYVTAGPLPPGCAGAAACSAVLLPARGAVRRASRMPGQDRWRFHPLPAGPYRLEVRRASDGWICTGPLTEIAPGRHTLEVAWRDPLPVHGLVVGADGLPRAGIEVRVAQPDRAAGVGALTRCAVEDPRAVTDAAGRFRVLADRCCPITLTAPGAELTLAPAQAEETIVVALP